MDKNSFIMYTNYSKHLQKLDQSQKGDLLDALFLYVDTGNEPSLDPVTSMAFSFICEDIQLNAKKWAESKEKRKAAGQQGGLAKASNARNASECQANLAVNVNENVNVNNKRGKAAKTVFDHESKAYQCALWLDDDLRKRLPQRKPSTEETLQKWADGFDKTNRIDGYDWELIRDVYEFSQKDSFWKLQIMSGDNFRKHFEKMYAKMGGGK